MSTPAVDTAVISVALRDGGAAADVSSTTLCSGGSVAERDLTRSCSACRGHRIVMYTWLQAHQRKPVSIHHHSLVCEAYPCPKCLEAGCALACLLVVLLTKHAASMCTLAHTCEVRSRCEKERSANGSATCCCWAVSGCICGCASGARSLHIRRSPSLLL